MIPTLKTKPESMPITRELLQGLIKEWQKNNPAWGCPHHEQVIASWLSDYGMSKSGREWYLDHLEPAGRDQGYIVWYHRRRPY